MKDALNRFLNNWKLGAAVALLIVAALAVAEGVARKVLAFPSVAKLILRERDHKLVEKPE